MAKIRIRDKKKFLTLVAAVVAVVVVIILIITLSGKKDGQDDIGDEGVYDSVVSGSVNELKSYWNNIYDMNGNSGADKIIEIKDTRIIKLNSDKDPQLKNIKYIVEFDLYTNLYSTSPYLIREDKSFVVAVSYDGTYEVWADNPLDVFLEGDTPNADHVKELVAEVIELGDKYNEKIKL